jgi:hypothetical protein
LRLFAPLRETDCYFAQRRKGKQKSRKETRAKSGRKLFLKWLVKKISKTSKTTCFWKFFGSFGGYSELARRSNTSKSSFL